MSFLSYSIKPAKDIQNVIIENPDGTGITRKISSLHVHIIKTDKAVVRSLFYYSLRSVCKFMYAYFCFTV